MIGAASEGSGLDSPKTGALSPSGSVVRGFFPSSKSRSLKKKNSILASKYIFVYVYYEKYFYDIKNCFFNDFKLLFRT